MSCDELKKIIEDDCIDIKSNNPILKKLILDVASKYAKRNIHDLWSAALIVLDLVTESEPFPVKQELEDVLTAFAQE
jgi:hypothetical protein